MINLVVSHVNFNNLSYSAAIMKGIGSDNYGKIFDKCMIKLSE